MILYHGTTQVIREVDLSKGRLRTDFGRGFYLGNNLEVAEKWAISRAVFSGTPVVMRYTLNFAVFSDEAVNSLNFDEPSVEWLNFVKDNRQRNNTGNTGDLRHRHGIVCGPIANDKVNFVVEDYIKGKISAAEAIAKAKTLPNAIQISIHSSEALEYLQVDDAQYQEYLPNATWSAWTNI